MQRSLDFELESNVTETSKLAFRELDKETIAQRYQEYLKGLWELDQPSTDQEVSKHLGHADPNYVRPRRFELENFHRLIFECNSRECSITHRMAKTFWFTAKGLEMIE